MVVVERASTHRLLLPSPCRSDVESIATTASVDSKESAQPVPSIKVSSPEPGDKYANDDVDAPDNDDVVLRQKKTDFPNKVSHNDLF
jgi:DNA-directed RNA polymerase specialized sigma54-like protein